MQDIRLQRLANVLVNYSTKVKPGDWVGILGDVTTLPALREVFKAVVAAGGNPFLIIDDEYMARHFLNEANDDQFNWLNPAMTAYYEQGDVYIRVGTSTNTRAMTNIPAARTQKLQKARWPWMETRLNRSAEGQFRWVGTWYPSEASAQEANMSLEEYEDFVFGATFCDKDDPIAEWQAIHDMQQDKIDWLVGKKHIKLKGSNIDLSLSVEDRLWINSDGSKNMPSGEIFTGPVEDSVNGWVRFSYPSIVQGRAVKGIELRFENGRVADASAEENEELLFAQLDSDSSSRYLGEFAIGTNFGINKFTGNILFDEKIGGTIHMAIGMGYPETGSKNKSTVHWDMICDMREDSEIHVDDELFYRNGEFVV